MTSALAHDPAFRKEIGLNLHTFLHQMHSRGVQVGSMFMDGEEFSKGAQIHSPDMNQCRALSKAQLGAS
jgi:hypothetical protein